MKTASDRTMLKRIFEHKVIGNAFRHGALGGEMRNFKSASDRTMPKRIFEHEVIKNEKL